MEVDQNQEGKVSSTKRILIKCALHLLVTIRVSIANELSDVSIIKTTNIFRHNSAYVNSGLLHQSLTSHSTEIEKSTMNCNQFSGRWMTVKMIFSDPARL